MRARARNILSRFPSHFDALREEKRLFEVVSALSVHLDAQLASLGSIRDARRLGQARTQADLLLIGGLHGLQEAELAVMAVRFEKTRALMSGLTAAVDAGDTVRRDQLAEQLIALWGLRTPPPLSDFAPASAAGAGPDLAAAAKRLLDTVAGSIAHRARVEVVRRRVRETCRIHAAGNGSVPALLAATAAALDLKLGAILHSRDRFWHEAQVRDCLGLQQPLAPDGGGDTDTPTCFAPGDETIAIEENPMRREESDLMPLTHAELFSVRRRGFDRAVLQIRVTGRDDKTLGPLLVNRDEGHGVGFTEAVPSGATLVFQESGRVELDGVDVTPLVYAWQGACFAGEDATANEDFVFADAEADEGAAPAAPRLARFAQAVPRGALKSSATFPGSGNRIVTPGIGVGETRFAFFVQQAHFSSQPTGEGAAPRLVAPRPAVGFLDGSVFAAGGDEALPVAGELQLSWLEHEAFAARVLIPSRFRTFGDRVRTELLTALARFKPAGVNLTVDFTDPHWILGQGIVYAAGPTDSVELARAGTVLWAGPEE